jgi:hypothetical protein
VAKIAIWLEGGVITGIRCDDKDIEVVVYDTEDMEDELPGVREAQVEEYESLEYGIIWK